MFTLEEAETRVSSRRTLRLPTFKCETNRCTITGPNGAGKTTFLRMLMGRAPLSRGRMTRSFSRPFFIPADPRRVLLPWYTLEQNLKIFGFTGIPNPRTFFSSFGMDFGLLARQRVYSLSQGETALSAVFCGLALEPDVLIMDETLAYLHPTNQEKLVLLIGSDAFAGVGVIWVTHNLALDVFRHPWCHMMIGS